MKIWLCLVLFIAGCRKAELNDIDNLNNGKIDILAHGGGGF
jgi:hypothetical protein